jgi:hypothetical protein
LTGGTYVVTGTLKFNNANIQTNAAAIVLDGAAAQILNQSNADALANFATNAAAGRFTIQNGRNFTTAGAFSNAGTLTIGTGCSFTVGGAYTQTGGGTTLNGTLAASGLVDLQAGVLSGAGTINASVRNNARIDVGGAGAAGLLTINGSYTQTASGVLNIAIGGYTAGSDYGQLAVSGAVSLGGTLNVVLINDFTPVAGDAFLIVTSNTSVSGTFATVNADPVFMPPVYNPKDVTLKV